MDIRKIIKCYTSIVTLVAFCYTAQARTEIVYLKGDVRDKLAEGSDLIINIYSLHTKFGVNSLSSEYKAKISDKGTFDLEITAPDSLFYAEFQFRSVNTQKNILSTGGVKELYLLAMGDSCQLKLNFELNSIRAIGKGADRINCQNELYRISYRPSGATDRAFSLARSGEIERGMEMEEVIKYHMVDLQLKILDSYRGQFSNEVYRRVYLDCLGLAKLKSISYLLAMYDFNRDKLLIAKRKFSKLYHSEIEKFVVDTVGLANSAYFTDYIFELERINLIFGQNVDTVKNSYSSHDLYTVFNNKYTGELNQKLKLSLVYFMALKQEVNTSLIDRIAPELKSRKYIVAFENWKKERMKLFEFDLPDVVGRRWKSTDFRGKLVVMDFWFNGCFGCAQMKEVLSPVVKKYKLDTNVVFIAVSVDPTKKSWMAGLRKGIYTFSGHLNLYTEGLGSRHPLIKNYNFTGYPQLLIFDKEGRNIPLNVSHPAMLGPDGIDRLIRKHK